MCVCVCVCVHVYYVHACMSVCVDLFVGHYLATKVYIGKLPATGWTWVIKGRLMMKGGHGQQKLVARLNWGAFDHASHAPQLRSCNYYLCLCIL